MPSFSFEDRPPNPLVLLVEDSTAEVDLIQRALGKCGITPRMEIAWDGEDALRRLRRTDEHTHAETPSLVILDLNLPRINGHEVLRQMKADPALRPVPVVVLTVSSADSDVVSAYEGAATSYLTKPADLEEYEQAICTMADYWLRVVRLPSEYALPRKHWERMGND